MGRLPGSHYCVGWPVGPWWGAGWDLMSFQRQGGRGPGGDYIPGKQLLGLLPRFRDG